MSAAAAALPSLAGARILVVEDETLIAMELHGLLARRGAEVLGPVPTVARALTTLETRRPDAAVLDLNLRGTRSTAVAEALASMRVPFVIASGYSVRHVSEAVLRAAPMVAKPIEADALLLALGRLLGREAPPGGA